MNAQFISALAASDINVSSFRPKDLVEFAEANGFTRKDAYAVVRSSDKIAHGVYNMSGIVVPMKTNEDAPQVPQASVASDIQSILNEEVYVPQKDATFVRWGYFKDVKKIIDSRMFFPVYIAGLSGNGKTIMVEQACAMSKREYVRVQITPETDEDDLIGGFRLINGETVFAKGPVIKAMEAGAILLIDEIDRGSNKLMALQGVLEGKPVLIKKTGEVIQPAPGFNVIATANTKGQGSDDGRFIAATVIDEAFLERFTITMEQPYPTAAIEKKIVTNHMKKFGCEDEDFADKLINWGQAIRKTFEDGGVEEIISTRRMCHAVQTFSIFKDRKKAIELVITRFDEDTRSAFIDLYEKIDAEKVEHDTTQSFENGFYEFETAPF
jgi:MoxR-like ATPase